MAEFRHNKESGETFIFDEKTQAWRGARPMEVNIGRAGAVGQGLAAAQGATGIPGLISGELGQSLGAVNPLAERVGLLGSLGSAAGPLAIRGAGKLTQRVLARQGATEAATAAKGGQSALTTSQGFRRNPDELLPDAAQGAGRILRAGAETLPVTRIVSDFLIRNPNQRNLNRLAGRAIGATDDDIARAGGKLTDDVLAAADGRVSAMFDEVATGLGDTLDPQVVMNQALEANNAGLITNRTLSAMARKQDAAGDNLMELRSELLAAHRGESVRAARNEIANRIDAIDDIIKEATVDNEPLKRLYTEARARYRASLALDKGQALGKTGDVNAASLHTALKSVYKRSFTRGKDKASDTMPADVQNFLQGAREAQGVNIGVPSSGTAERLFAASLLGGTVGTSLQ